MGLVFEPRAGLKLQPFRKTEPWGGETTKAGNQTTWEVNKTLMTPVKRKEMRFQKNANIKSHGLFQQSSEHTTPIQTNSSMIKKLNPQVVSLLCVPVEVVT